MAIKVRRGTDAQRLLVLLEQGEIAYTTDTKKFYVGDGTTYGGNEITGATALSQLTDVSISSPVYGNILMYDGSHWINSVQSVYTLDQVTTAGNTTTNAINVGLITGNSGISQFKFNTGAGSATPTIAVGNTDTGGKFAALLAGTAGSEFNFDRSGWFAIAGDTKSNYNSNNLGSGAESYYLRISGATGNIMVNSTTDAGYKFDVNGSIRGTSLSIVGGTSSGFLKADGSVDTTSYLTISRNLTINGITYDLSTDRAWTVAPGGTSGQILAKNSSTNYDWSWIDNYTEDVRDTVKASVAINKGQAVYISGANGTNQLVSLADYSSELTSSKTLGLARQNFAINDIGQVTTYGLVSGFDTSSATAGDPVWLGANGNLIYGYTSKPVAPKHLVFIGVVTRAHATQGEIFVRVQNGFELDELHDVLITSKTNKDVLYYDASTSLWKNGQISSVLGYTPVPTTRNLTINGVTYDLSADRTWTISTATPTLDAVTTAGNTTTNSISVGKITTTGSITASAALAQGSYFNNTLVATANNDVLVGLDINTTFTNGSFTGVLNYPFRVTGIGVLGYFRNSSGGGGSSGNGVAIQVDALGNGLIYAFNYTPADPTSGISAGANFGFNGSNTNFYGMGLAAIRSSKYDIWFQTGAINGGGYRFYKGTTELFTIFQSGNVGINTTTDAGYKLDVNGTARIQGAITGTSNILLNAAVPIIAATGTNGLLTLQSSSSNVAGIKSVTNFFDFKDQNDTNTLLRVHTLGNYVTIGGNTNLGALFNVTGSKTASSALAQGVYFNNTLVAAANNDVLVGLDINPTFTNGAFTGVANYGIRTNNSAIVQGQVSAVTGTPTATPSTTGGTLAIGTYYYKIVAVDGKGNTTTGSAEVSATTTTATSSVALSWTAVQNASSYRIYRGTSAGGESVYYTSTTNSYTDTNATSTAGTVPTVNTTYLNGFLTTGRRTMEADSSVTTQTSAVIQATTTNANLVLNPNGTGAIVASIPDGTATGGNARGTNAVDLQMSRSAATQIAAYSGSGILSGINNTVLTNYSVICGGSGNTINHDDLFYISIVGGLSNSITGRYGFIGGGQSNTGGAYNVPHTSILGGQSNTASGTQSSVLGGFSNSASGVLSIVGGTSCYAAGNYSVALGRSLESTAQSGFTSGAFGTAYLYAQRTHGNSSNNVPYNSNAQISDLISRKIDTLTTGGTTVLSLDGTGTTNLVIPGLIGSGNSRAWNVQVNWVAVVTAITGTATGVTVGDTITQVQTLGFKRLGGTSSLVGTANTLSTNSNTSMSTASMAYTVGASQELALTFTAPTFAGGGTVTCRVVARVELTEVAY